MKSLFRICGVLLALGAVRGVAAETGKVSGKVVETMNAASYTYVLLDTGAKKSWVAAAQFPVKVGDAVVATDAMPMANYHSKTLNRTFDVIHFSGAVTVNGKAPGAGSAAELPAGHPPMGKGAGAAAPDLAGIKRADGGQTVAEINTGKGKLAGKPVLVRGRVVKFNPMIMGKNWLHIRDGSGAEGTNDLTVTTDTKVKVGDLVVVSGTLSADRDFGSGYKYGLIVENAKVTVE